MRPSRSLLAALIILIFQVNARGQDYKILQDPAGLTAINSDNGIENPVTVKVIYDNYVRAEGFKSDWGYSVLIEGLEKTILFDTGAKPDIFDSNLKKMGTDVSKIGILVFSHEHGDHTAGAAAFIKLRTNIPVIIPYSFSDLFKKNMAESGFTPLLVKTPVKICTDLYSSGEFSGPIPEQALVLNTRQGLVVMTGCSHPGIVKMLGEIKTAFNKNIYMVFGGFHLLQKSESEMKEILDSMKSLGVVKCGATHCTGVTQTKMIRDAFGTDFVELGAGNIIVLN